MYTKLWIRPQMSISPQLVISGKILQVPGSELEQFINKELAENPALEFANKPDYPKTKLSFAASGDQQSSNNIRSTMAGLHFYSSFEDTIERIAQHQSPLEKLTEQVSMTAGKTDRDIAILLLHCLDHHGFLTIPTEKLASELGISEEAVIRAIRILHQLQPPGIGARNIQECFLLQCTQLEAEGIDCQTVRRILTLAWTEFLNQQWERVAKKIGGPIAVVREACEFMRLNLYPYPLAMLDTSTEANQTLEYPDLIVNRNNDPNSPGYTVIVPGERDFELTISSSFREEAGAEAPDESGRSAKEKAWIKVHLDRASLLMSALRQRWETLRRIGEYLIQHQSDFLEHGPLYIKPLTRAMMARALNVHESTVSRAVSDKIIQLPNSRLIPLSDFFDSSLAAKEAIRLLLKNNARRLCDREIAEGLQANGMNISRRTVTKYRQEINLDSSRPRSIEIWTLHIGIWLAASFYW